MLNTNFKKLMHNQVFTGEHTTGNTIKYISGNYGNSGTYLEYSMNQINSSCYPLTETGTNKGGWFLYYGSGTTTPTDTDYNLENPFTPSNSNIKCISMTKLVNGKSIYLTSMIRNDGTEPITISEMALGLNPNSNIDLTAMMGRIVLDTPVTLGVGDTKTFTYEIS